MRTVILSIILMNILPIFAQEKEKPVNAKVTAVTIFLNGAEVTHTVQVTVGKGRTNFIFSGIATSINEKSIRVSASNDIKIASISYERDYLEDKSQNIKIKSLQDTIKKISHKLDEISAGINAFDDERNLLIKNNSIGGQNTGVTSVELQKVADLYRVRLRDINSQKLKLEENKSNLQEYYDKINKQLNELNNKQTQPVYYILVSVNSLNQVTSTMEIKYLVKDAGWDPYYDIRAIDVNNPINLDYKAKIYNNSGIDWNEVKLTLSTADPSQTSQKPKLDPWNLNYKSNDDHEGYLNVQGYKESKSMEKDKEGKIAVKEQASTIDVSELTVEFEIKTPYTLPSNNKIYMADIQSVEIPATYTYFAVPKLDKDAFLLVSITGWESLNLIEGVANIFYGGTYVGQSYIDTRFANDTLDISLGRDKKVAITRTKKQDFVSKRTFATDCKESFAYEISVRNNNKVIIDIEIQDQIPVSQENDIKVEPVETSGITPEDQSGMLKYKFKLNPSESKIIKIAYSVQYPKSKPLMIRKSRQTHRSARFL